jgi:hypothetical protein
VLKKLFNTADIVREAIYTVAIPSLIDGAPVTLDSAHDRTSSLGSALDRAVSNQK